MESGSPPETDSLTIHRANCRGRQMLEEFEREIAKKITDRTLALLGVPLCGYLPDISRELESLRRAERETREDIRRHRLSLCLFFSSVSPSDEDVNSKILAYLRNLEEDIRNTYHQTVCVLSGVSRCDEEDPVLL